MQRKCSSFTPTQTWSHADARSIIIPIFQLLHISAIRKIRTSTNQYWETISYNTSIWKSRIRHIVLGHASRDFNTKNIQELVGCTRLTLRVAPFASRERVMSDLSILNDKSHNGVQELIIRDTRDVNVDIQTILRNFMYKQDKLKLLTLVNSDWHKSDETPLLFHTFPELQYLSYDHKRNSSLIPSILRCTQLHTLELHHVSSQITDIRHVLTLIPTLYKITLRTCTCEYKGRFYPPEPSNVKQITINNLYADSSVKFNVIRRILNGGDMVEELRLSNFFADSHIEDPTQLLKLKQLQVLIIEGGSISNFTEPQIIALSAIFQSHPCLSKVLLKGDVVLWSRQNMCMTIA